MDDARKHQVRLRFQLLSVIVGSMSDRSDGSGDRFSGLAEGIERQGDYERRAAREGLSGTRAPPVRPTRHRCRALPPGLYLFIYLFLNFCEF